MSIAYFINKNSKLKTYLNTIIDATKALKFVSLIIYYFLPLYKLLKYFRHMTYLGIVCQRLCLNKCLHNILKGDEF